MAKRTQTHPNEAAFPKGMSGPSLRALANAGITTMAGLTKVSDAFLLAQHGFGPKALKILRDAQRRTAGRP